MLEDGRQNDHVVGIARRRQLVENSVLQQRPEILRVLIQQLWRQRREWGGGWSGVEEGVGWRGGVSRRRGGSGGEESRGSGEGLEESRIKASSGKI